MWKFLPNEKLVIMSLVEDATRTDAEIAELNGMNAGTVAAVRRRLLDAGALFFVNIPSFNKLGCEMIAFHHGALDPAVPFDAKSADYMRYCSSSPQTFDAIISTKSVLFYSVLRNVTELEEYLSHHNRFFSGENRRSKARVTTATFPYAVTKGTYALNYAPTVSLFLELEGPEPKPREPTSVEVTSADLTENEKQVLMALVENPNSPDRETAVKSGVSRQSVTRIRRKMEEEGYLTLVCVPRLYRWGFEIYSAIHAHFSSDFAYSDLMDKQPQGPLGYSFFSLFKADEAVVNYMTANFQDYSRDLDEAMAWYHERKAFEKEPAITMLPLEHCIELKTHDFAPALRNLLDGT